MKLYDILASSCVGGDGSCVSVTAGGGERARFASEKSRSGSYARVTELLSFTPKTSIHVF